MKLLSKKSISILLTVGIICTMLYGCTKPANQDSDEEKITLTMWAPTYGHIAATATNMGELEIYQELEKRTGIHIEFQHPPEGQTQESLNVMLASGELPDMIEYEWLHFPGGPETALESGFILKLNDLIDKHAPNLKKYYAENPDVEKMVKTDNGTHYVFPGIKSSRSQVFWGPIIRKDWLDDLNLEVPTIIDEWYTALKGFKEEKGATSPFTVDKVYSIGSNFGDFSGAYGVKKGFYQVDGKVVFGDIQPEFKEFLATMKKWYDEGLLDPDFAVNDNKAVDAKITSGQAGAVCTFASGGLSKYSRAMKEKDPSVELVAAPYPTLREGEVPRFGQLDNKYNGYGCVAITTSCKQPEIAAKWLDYAYGEEGHMLFNYGIEGVSYNMIDGNPVFTDLVLNHPNGYTVKQAVGRYTRAGGNGPFVEDPRSANPNTPEIEKKANELWSRTEAAKYNLPPITPSAEESKEFATIMNEINTYKDEMFVKFIMGMEPLENFDKYVEQIKKMNIQRAIDIYQAALERYNNR